MVRLHWSFEDEQSLYLVMDACAGGTLRGWIANNGPLQPKLAVACATELVGGLCALHAAGIIHRDLKPESLQIGKDGRILITDFGCARLLTHFRQTSDEGDASLACGTREFQAPEIILGWAHDYAVDWWSFGLVMHAMLTGEHPFTDVIGVTRPSVLQARILYNDSRSSARSPVDSTASDLITKCLQRNPALRLDVRGIKTHGYFAHVNWADVLEGRMPAPFKLQDPAQITSYHGREKATVSPRSRDHRRLGSGAFSFSWAQDNSSIYSLGDANLTGLQTDPGTTYSRTSEEVNLSSLGTGNKSPFSTYLANLDRRATAANGSIPSEFGGRQDGMPKSAPVLELPQGVEQIGNGIAYTRRTDLQNTRLTMASLTPRTCHAFFSSGRFHGLTPKLNKKKTASDRKDQAQQSKGGAVMNGNDESEDAMDAVMREIYGSNWNVGLSATELPGAGVSPRGYSVSAKLGATPRAGLGWAESALTRYATPPADASTLGPDSTLRLVSPSASNPGLGL
ncbi:Protein kinase DC2 [Grifola frondosa]|uniref:Protein kinase DC2 n=1 Tax=Grifola frondosa TaxID=5627 RepID=A0A1C7MWD6_GRIFR|nr:Protein kinase DC2 [Grifola frondosa]